MRPLASFSVRISDLSVADLRERLARTRWPERETVGNWSQGVPLEYLQSLCEHWRTGYDMNRLASQLNAYPQWRAQIGGLGIHVLSARSPHPDALPLVLTHGWPGSVLEYRPLLGRLTDPPAYGGDERDAFDVVLPSLPGFGFSARPSEAGWGVERIAAAWAELMAALGYTRYGAAGSDWGTSISSLLGQEDHEHVVGIHLIPPLAGPGTDDPTPEERAALDELRQRSDDGGGYSAIQSTRPQTIGYSLVDSPAGLCAWLVEKYWEWADHDGDLETVIGRDELLDQVSLYWFTGTGASAARLYWESIGTVSQWFRKPPETTIDVPAGASVFAREVPRPSRRWAEARFPDLRLWREHGRGGHFPALEAPDELVEDLRDFFRPLR